MFKFKVIFYFSLICSVISHFVNKYLFWFLASLLEIILSEAQNKTVPVPALKFLLAACRSRPPRLICVHWSHLTMQLKSEFCQSDSSLSYADLSSSPTFRTYAHFSIQQLKINHLISIQISKIKINNIWQAVWISFWNENISMN